MPPYRFLRKVGHFSNQSGHSPRQARRFEIRLNVIQIKTKGFDIKIVTLHKGSNNLLWKENLVRLPFYFTCPKKWAHSLELYEILFLKKKKKLKLILK